MLVLKLIQSLIATLHSEGTPGQVAAGIALGSILGLTPLMNLHNAVVFGSLAFALAFWLPLFLTTRWGVARYRTTVADRMRRSRLYQAVTASKVYNLYRLFWPET